MEVGGEVGRRRFHSFLEMWPSTRSGGLVSDSPPPEGRVVWNKLLQAPREARGQPPLLLQPCYCPRVEKGGEGRGWKRKRRGKRGPFLKVKASGFSQCSELPYSHTLSNLTFLAIPENGSDPGALGVH